MFKGHISATPAEAQQIANLITTAL